MSRTEVLALAAIFLLVTGWTAFSVWTLWGPQVMDVVCTWRTAA